MNMELLVLGLIISFVAGQPPESTEPNTWPCSDGANSINIDFLCDGRNDCPDLSDEDESNCGNTCEFACHSDKKCAFSYQLCDGFPDCSDWSDESECPETACDGFTCVDSGRCISHRDVCDRYSDCSDSSDEKDCFKVTTTTTHASTTTTVQPTTSMASIKIPRKCKKNPSKSKCRLFWEILATKLTKRFIRKCVKKPKSKKCKKWRPVLEIKQLASPYDFVPPKCKKNPGLSKCQSFLVHISKQLPTKFIAKCHAKPNKPKCRKFRVVLNLVPTFVEN
ncbi:uncharacterized protein LOC100175608 [Ciona intestinalis]